MYQSKKLKRDHLQHRGIENLGNTCYLNAALQLIIQMNSINPNLLNHPKSAFSTQLQKILDAIQSKNDLQDELNSLLTFSKSLNIHERDGGDSYQIAISFLTKINQEVTSECRQGGMNEIKEFQNLYTLRFYDGFACKKCNNYLKKEYQNIVFVEEVDISIDILHIEQLTLLPSIYGEPTKILADCELCNSNTEFELKRQISLFPQLIIVKFNGENVQKIDNSYKEKVIEIKDILQNVDHQYKIVGYCSYNNNNHYTYTANYKDKWLEFNDSYVFQTNNLFQNVYYLLLSQVQADVY